MSRTLSEQRLRGARSEPQQADAPEEGAGARTASELVAHSRDVAVTRPATLSTVVARTAARTYATVQWLPVWVSAVTIGTYLLSLPADPALSVRITAISFGAIEGGLVFLAIALATNRSTLPDRANSRSFSDLSVRVMSAQQSLASARKRRVSEDDLPANQLAALANRVSEDDLDPEWSSGMAYVNQWRRLHHVEAELIRTADLADQWGILLHDELRVEGSKLDRKDSLVRSAIDQTKPLLEKRPPDDARGRLHEIRSAVNDFRDRRFEALVRGTNVLNRTSAMLGAVAWAALSIAIMAGASTVLVASASAFFLVGVGAGLLTQVHGNNLTKTHEDVYGFGRAHLIQTVLLSGIAAVAGVALTSAAAFGSVQGATGITFFGVLTVTPASLGTAALFGFAPGVLLDRMTGWAKANVKELESTGSSGEQD